ncbi:DUF6221 family protein [Streptomyces sp. NBC_00443]|uniref:DUF6221 family protein n=1 Tax=Streptomyces sp. NBC_00443 TaxID=2975743 RepID=UPI002E20098E
MQWLRAQLDEDERIARKATHHEDYGTWTAKRIQSQESGRTRWAVFDSVDDCVVSDVDAEGTEPEGVARHLELWDPARVLREIDAKRRIIGMYATALDDRLVLRERMRAVIKSDPDEFSRLHRQESRLVDVAEGLRPVVRLLMLPYADRPGWMP